MALRYVLLRGRLLENPAPPPGGAYYANANCKLSPSHMPIVSNSQMRPPVSDVTLVVALRTSAATAALPTLPWVTYMHSCILSYEVPVNGAQERQVSFPRATGLFESWPALVRAPGNPVVGEFSSF